MAIDYTQSAYNPGGGDIWQSLQSFLPLAALSALGLPTDLATALAGAFRGEQAVADANAANKTLDEQGRGLLWGQQPTIKPGQYIKGKDGSIVGRPGSRAGGATAGRPTPGLYDRVMSSVAEDRALTDADLRNLSQAATKGYGGLARFAEQGYGDIANQYDSTRSGAQAGGGEIARGLGQGLADLTRGYEQRRERALAMHEGLGQQEGADIREGYGDLARANAASLASSGLGGSTVGAAFRLGNEREQNKDLGRLNERLRYEKLGLDTGLSGDTLAAQERGLYGLSGLQERNLARDLDLSMLGTGARERGLATNLGLSEQGLVSGLNTEGNRISQNSAYGAEGRNADIGVTGTMLNWLSSQTHQAANSDPWAGLAQWAANKAMPTPEQPKWYDSFLGNAGGAAGAGLGIGLGGLFAAPFTGGLSLGASGAIPWGLSRSDKRIKTDFRDVDMDEILEGVLSITPQKWKYLTLNQERGDHIGPMAQDVKEKFKLGVVSDMTLNPVDMFGILWSCVHALNGKIATLEGELKKWRSGSNTAGRRVRASVESAAQ